MNVHLLRTACRTDCFLFDIHNLSGVWRFHGDQSFYHTNVHNPNQFEFPANFFSLAWLPCTSLFCPALSVLERVVLPAVQGKFTSNLYETCSTEPCTAGCTTDLYVCGNGPLAELPHSIHHRKTWLLVTFLLHKKALKSFLHFLTICDKVAFGNNNNKKIIGIP
jgi:hypothetical protein